MKKLHNMLALVLAVSFCMVLTSCSNGGLTEPNSVQDVEQIDPNGLGSKIARTIEWSGGDYPVDATDGDHERRADVTDVRCSHNSVWGGQIHKHSGTPSFVDDSIVVYAWQVFEYDDDEMADKWRVKWCVRYYDAGGDNAGWHFGTTTTIDNPAGTGAQTYPSITAYISSSDLMRVDVVYQQHYSTGSPWRIRHCSYTQGTAEDYSSFSLADDYPKEVSDNDGYAKKHADVVYFGRTSDIDRRLVVYEDYLNAPGSERAITYCYQNANESWEGHERLDKTGQGGNTNVAMYPRIDVGIDDSNWTLPGNGFPNDWVVCAVWHEYMFDDGDLFDIDVWANFFDAVINNPDDDDAIDVWFHDDLGSDYETDDHFDVFPYVDFDPVENLADNRFIHIIWTHFKDGYTNSTNLYWNTEMIENVAWPVAIKDVNNSEEGLCTIAVKVGGDRAYACYIFDQSTDDEVGACYISYSTYSSITTGGETVVSNGYASRTVPPVYGPVNAIRNGSYVHVIWPDMQDPSDGDIYSDWN